MNRNDLIKKIHVLKRDLGMVDDDYRLVLYNISEKTSCRDIALEELNLIAISLSKIKDNTGLTSKVVTNGPQHRQIARLMGILGWAWKDTAKFCLRVTGKNSTRACSTTELSYVIRGLIGVIDSKLKRGEIKMSDTELLNYREHTNNHRQKEAVK